LAKTGSASRSMSRPGRARRSGATRKSSSGRLKGRADRFWSETISISRRRPRSFCWTMGPRTRTLCSRALWFSLPFRMRASTHSLEPCTIVGSRGRCRTRGSRATPRMGRGAWVMDGSRPTVTVRAVSSSRCKSSNPAKKLTRPRRRYSSMSKWIEKWPKTKLDKKSCHLRKWPPTVTRGKTSLAQSLISSVKPIGETEPKIFNMKIIHWASTSTTHRAISMTHPP